MALFSANKWPCFQLTKTEKKKKREVHRDLLLAAALLGDAALATVDVAGKVTARLTRLYLDPEVKWQHRLILPMSVWLLLIMGLYRYGPLPSCLIPLGTLIWWGVWFLSVDVRDAARQPARTHELIGLGLWLLSADGVFPRLSVITLPHRLSGRCKSASLRDRVISGIVRLPEPQQTQIVESLVQALGDGSEDVREAAAEALGEIGDPRAVEPLIQALGDEDRPVGWAAVWALKAIGDPRAVEPLIQALGDESEDVRGAAVWALKAISDPRAVEPLTRVLGDGSEDVRRAAARALGEIGDRRAVEPLSLALGDEDRYVRRAAVEALKEIGDRRAVEPLSLALGDRSEDVRRAAAEALGEIGDRRAVELLSLALGDRSEDVRRAAAEALETTSKKVENDKVARRVARRLWWRLTDAKYVANAAWEALARVVARLTELEVTALNGGPPLFAPVPGKSRPSPMVLAPVALGILIAALSGLASNILAAYLQERYRLITDTGRFGLVVAVFVLTLVASIWLALRQAKRTTETAKRK